MIVMGDMNAKVESVIPGNGGVVGKHGLGINSDIGSRFVDLCERCGLVIGGTSFFLQASTQRSLEKP